MLEKGVCGPCEIVAVTVVFQNQLGMIMKQLTAVHFFKSKFLNCFKGCIYHYPLNKKERKVPAAS